MANSTATSTSTVVVDDYSNSTALHYSGNWTHLYNIGGALNGTLSYATTDGASVVFTFNGTEIVVAGAVTPVNGTLPATSIYSIDGTVLESYTAPANITDEETGVPFFLAKSLSSGLHQLVINVTHVTDDAPYLLDYIAYIPFGAAQPTSTPSLSASLYIPSYTGTPPSDSSAKPVGAIIGGVIGGVALLLFAAAALWFLRRRHAKNQPYFYEPNPTAMPQDDVDAEPKEPVPENISPFLTTTPDPLLLLPPVIHASSSGIHLGHAPSLVSLATQGGGSIRHEDSGLRFTSSPEPIHPGLAEPSDVLDEIPPEYTEL